MFTLLRMTSNNDIPTIRKFSVNIESSEGPCLHYRGANGIWYVNMPADICQYRIRLTNMNNLRGDAKIWIDKTPIGKFRVEAKSSWAIEGPEIVFSVKDSLQPYSDIMIYFYKEMPRDYCRLHNEPSSSDEEFVTSPQNFKKAEKIEYDHRVHIIPLRLE